MRRAALACLALTACATPPPAAPSLQAQTSAALVAAILGPCAAYVAAPPESRALPPAPEQAGVAVLALGDDPSDPLCLALAQGEGAAAAGHAAAAALMTPEAGFARFAQQSPAQSDTFYVVARPPKADDDAGLIVEVDLQPNEGVETAAFLVSPLLPPAPMDPAAPSAEEEAAAAALSLPQAFAIGLFELAPQMTMDLEDEAAERRWRALGASGPGGVFVMRMSTPTQMVGLEPLDDDTIQIIAMGAEAPEASGQALARLRAEGWSFAGFEASGGGVLLRCYDAPDAAARACVSDAVRIEAQTVTVARLGPIPR